MIHSAAKRCSVVLIASLCASLMLLTACGGGGASAAPSAPPTTTSNPTPSVSSISPTSATVGSSSVQVTVTGSGFTSSSTAQWNGSARPTTFVSSTQLQAAIPASDLAATGTAQITVSNPSPGGGTSTAASFAVNNPAPVVTTINPSSVVAGATSTTLTISGTGFVAASVAQWNGTLRPTTFVSSTQLQVAISASDLAATGTAQITVSNPSPGGGTSTAASFAVNNPAPVVTTINPSFVAAGATSTTLTISGTGFVASSVAQWNGTLRTTTFVSSTQLQVAIPGSDLATAGTAQITVTNPAPGGGTSTAASFAVNNPAPGVTTVSPSSVLAGGSATTLTVSGTGFVASSVAQWNGSPRTTTFVDSTHLQAAIPASDIASGASVPITVSNSGPGGGVSGAVTFTVTNPAPAVASVAPSTTYVSDQNLVVTVTGTGFVPASVAQWNGAARTTLFVSSGSLQVTLTAADVASAGSGTITVVNTAPGGGSSTGAAVAVQYALPTVSSLSPSTVVMGSPNTLVNIYGTGFTPASVVKWAGTPLTSMYLNSGQLRAGIPAANLATSGTADITVVNPAPVGGASAAKTFTISTYPVPTITSVSPNNLTLGSPDTSIAVYGTGLQPVSKIQVNGTDLPTTYVLSYYDGPFLMANLPASYLTAVGTLQITVNTPPPSGGTSNALTISVVAPPPPTISSIQPISAAIGGPAFTLSVSGSNFARNSVVRWNGSDRPTTFVSTSLVTAAITAADIATFAAAQVSVYTPPPGGGTTTSLPFNTYLPVPTNDMVYSPADKLLYVSVPSSAGSTLGNSIVSIDPNTGVLGTPIWVGSEPNKLAISSDGSTLWVGLDGAGAVRQVNLATQTAGLQFGLGGVTGVYNSPNTAVSIAVMPGSPNTIAVAPSNSSTWWNGGVTIYDSGVPRAKTFSNGGAIMNVNTIAFSSSGNSLYALGSGYAVLSVDSTGISSSVVKNSSVSGNTFVYDSGKIYLSSGAVLDANSGTQLGVFSVSPTQQASGPIAVDSVVGKAFILVNPNYSTYQINAYGLSSYVLAGSTPVGSFGQSYPYDTHLVRWGQDGLAFRNSSQVFIMHSSLVRDLSISLADVAVAVSSPTAAIAGSDVTYSVTVTNKGTVTASPAVLINNLPNGAVFKSLTTTQGTCSGTTVVRCNLGDLSSSATVTVQITATLLSTGTATNTSTVSAPQSDPDLTNNTASTTTVASGSDYSPSPNVASISPAVIAAGSAGFTLTVNGAGFVPGTTVNWNGAALSTSYVSSSLLTAEVDATNVANMGWAWVNVTNPGPGGGTSSSMLFSTYLALNLSSNHILFDPFTRKIYASIPSTATQVSGNSVVAIDPSTGSMSAPLFVGSEPNYLAESPDGKYLYIGLDGSKSLTRVDLASMTQGSVFPLTITSTYSPGPTKVRSMAVMPGNDNTLVIDTGSWTGIGMFDISGTTGGFRSNFTGPYTGSNVTFANASTVYSYDSDTSGATFNRWTVGSSGLTAIDESTLFGMGGFSGKFVLQDGLIYGVSGGVVNPSSTPPSQIGRYPVTSYGLAQSLQPSGIAVDPASDRVFFTGSSTAGSALPYLISFNSKRFTVTDVLQWPGSSLSGTDLQRWGRDGLVWQMSGWPYGSSSTVILMRGPLVLPQWSVSNPVAVADSISPNIATAGSGNLTATITGSNFVPGAVALWNGAERTTTFVDATHLRVAIPASDLATAGSATLTIENPGATTSGGITLTIN